MIFTFINLCFGCNANSVTFNISRDNYFGETASLNLRVDLEAKDCAEAV